MTNQAISPREKFLPSPLSGIVEYDLRAKEDGEEEGDTKRTRSRTMTTEIKTQAKKNGTTTTYTTTYVIVEEKLNTSTGDEEENEEEDQPSKEGEENVDEGKTPDGDADEQGQPPGPGDVQVPSYYTANRDGPYTKPSITGEDEDDNPVFLGLKVYTNITKEAVVTISGRVLGGPDNGDEDEWEDEAGGGADGDEDS